MKKDLFIAMVISLCSTFTWAQGAFETKKVEVLSSSELTITGDTNINKFECEFDTALMEAPQLIDYSRTGSEIKFTGALLTLYNRGFDCGSKGINQDFHRLLKTEKYPEILLEINRINFTSPTKGVASVCITMAGKQNFYDVPVRIKDGEIAHFKGSLKLNINDYNLQPPKKLFGMIVVKDDIEINFDLLVKK